MARVRLDEIAGVDPSTYSCHVHVHVHDLGLSREPTSASGILLRPEPRCPDRVRSRIRVAGTWFLAAAALFAIGCRASEAGPGSGLTPPAGWHALPSLSTAASDAAKGTGIKVEGAEAWGEPARGCYAAWLALAGGKGTPDKLADQLVTSLSAEPTLAGITVRDVVKPTAGMAAGTLSLGFSHAPYTGKLRAQLVKDGHIALLACFWNEREPVACETACTSLLGSMK